jgi:hypothetical protein
VDSPRSTSDDPLDKRDLLTRQSANVLEGYQAIYMTVDGRWVRVRAVRFDDPKWTAAGAMARLSGGPSRIIKGPVAMLLERIPENRLGGIALEQACYDIVRDHISSIKFPMK